MDSLSSRYDALVCDLDGVVYRGPEPVPHAVDALNAAGERGLGVAYATNNASRPPAEVAGHLRELGIRLTDDAVINSSQAGAATLAESLPTGSAVLAVGGAGVADALRECGFDVRTAASATADGGVVAVLQGYGPDVTAADLSEIAYAVQQGARWVATNTDLTLPTARGTAPGNGSLVAAVRAAVTVDPEVVGKPGPLMYTMAARLLGASSERTLGIGDRLETDVAGARAAGMHALHVLTGVHGPADLVAAPAELRPQYVADDLRALDLPYEQPQRGSEGRTIGYTTSTASARLVPAQDGWSLEVDGSPSPIERLRLALRVLWDARDAGLLDDRAARSLVSFAH